MPQRLLDGAGHLVLIETKPESFRGFRFAVLILSGLGRLGAQSVRGVRVIRA